MRRVLAVLFAIGVVVGSWRVLGDGADITDPAWVTNATKNVGELFGWSDEAVRERTKNSPTARPLLDEGSLMLKKVLYVLIALGVIRGLIRYNEDTGSEGAERLLMAFIDGVADITYRWLPALLDLLNSVLGGLRTVVMGPTHAMSGAAAWVIGAPAVVAATGNPALSTPELLVGAAVCAGSALLPDIDEPQSTVSRSFGPVTQALAHVVNAASAAVHNATGTRKDGHVSNGHRTVTHTALFAVAAGIAVGALIAAVGRPAVIGVLFFTLGLAARGLIGDWAKRQGWIGVTAVSLAGAWAAAETLSDGRLWWLGAAVTVGAILHGIGDALTKEGVPWLAPVPVRGKAWWEFNTGPLSFRAGGLVEYTLVAPALTAATVLGVIHAVDPALFTSLVGL